MSKEAFYKLYKPFLILFDGVFMTKTNDQTQFHLLKWEQKQKKKPNKGKKTQRQKNNFQWVKYTCFFLLNIFYLLSVKTVGYHQLLI